MHFDPTNSLDMPVERKVNSWWECGCENMNTYTQAFCKQNLVGVDEQENLQRIRYKVDTNMLIWTVRQTEEDVKWDFAGRFQVLGALSISLSAAAAALSFALF